MSLANVKGNFPVIAAAILALLSQVIWSTPATAQTSAKISSQSYAKVQICNVKADFALGREDYPAAIVLHRRLLQAQPITPWHTIIWVLPTA